MERSQDDSIDTDTAQPTGGYSPPLPAYEALPLSIMSTLLEHKREVEPDILYQQMRNGGVARNRVTACIRKTLLRNEMLWLEDGVIMATENGTDYVAANTHHIEEAEREAPKPKKEPAEAAKDVAKPAASEANGQGPSDSNVLLTVQAMRKEVNNMHKELDESEEDFDDVTGYSGAKLRTLASELSTTMAELGERLDAPPEDRL